jgi:hypothetical protein
MNAKLPRRRRSGRSSARMWPNGGPEWDATAILFLRRMSQALAPATLANVTCKDKVTKLLARLASNSTAAKLAESRRNRTIRGIQLRNR